jgi:Multicopper oxidase
VRFEMQNRSIMAHPVHLLGHFFQVENGTGYGPFKDTVLIEPRMGGVTFNFVADNPGEWLFHCPNLKGNPLSKGCNPGECEDRNSRFIPSSIPSFFPAMCHLA